MKLLANNMLIQFRMERINIKERRSQAKIAGTLITVGGALLMILFSGPVVTFPWTKHSTGHAVADSASHSSGRWLMGIFMILLSCFCWSAFFILQVNSFTLFSCLLFQLLQLCRDRDIGGEKSLKPCDRFGL